MSFPSRFGKFLLLERVNVGGMAEVFKAKTTGVAGFERILAIKRILPNLVEDDDFIRMFIDEARIAVQLNHANIVQIYELGKQGEHYYIAMEYIPSRDLRGILDRLRASGQLMPIAQAAHITAKVAEGLDYAHRRKDPQGSPMNIIHRDVSPQNILVGFEGEVKVIDFGIAKAANRASKTQAGVLKGKFGYMSPEQVRGLPIDRRSDIFAVGVLLYEMLTGERLFIGESDFSTLERVRNADVVPPTSFNKKISPQLEAIVLKTLAREVEDRYQWASELAQDLQAFVADTAGAFNARRLSASMREMYAPEVALEKKKLEEFMRILPEDVKEKPNAQPMSVLPLPQRGGQSMQGQSPIDDDDGGGFGADKTFVIEASAAGLALGAPATDPGARALPKKPLLTANDASDEVSLYGGGGGDSDDDDADARTLVGAENPYFAPPPAAPNNSARVDAATRPTSPPPAPPPPMAPPPNATMSAPKPRAVAPGRPFDAVAAAMAEEGGDVDVAVSGALGSLGSPFAPPTLSQSQDRPTMSQPSMPPQYSVTSTPPEPWPAQPAPPPPRPPATPAPRRPAVSAPPAAVLPMPWVPLGVALAVSGLSFAAALAFFVMRYLGAADATPAQLQLTAVGAVPADLVISLDDAEVGRTLPLEVALLDGKHVLHVKGTGIDLRRDVVGTGGTVRQPVVFDATGGAAPGAWRLLLAAVGEDGSPVEGAEVFVNGRSLGVTPLEAELADAAETLALRVRKAGYAESTIDLKRAGRIVVGPATVSLKKGELTTTAVEPSNPEGNPEPLKVEPVKVEPVKVEPAKPEPAKPEPVKVEPVKPDPAKPDPAKPTTPTKPEPAKPEPAKPEPAKPEPAKPPVTPGAKVADIQLGTSPYADTTIDGRKYGMTPFFGPRTLTLPVGVHRIEFFDKVNNKKYKYQLKLKAPDPNNKVVIQFNKNDPPKVEGQVELKKID